MTGNKPKNKVRNASLKLSTGLLLTSAIMPSLATPVFATTSTPEKIALENSSSASNSTIEELPTVGQTSSDSATETESSTTETTTTNSETETTETSTSESTTESSTSTSSKPKPPKPGTSSSSKPNKPGVSTKPSNSSSQGNVAGKTPENSKKPLERKDLSVVVDGSISYAKNQTTQEFIANIAKDARIIGDKNGIYASVMIAQAILESSSGNSTLAREPNFNLFGIKGKYQGQSIALPTLEDDGSGSMFSINANFRKYPSYKESLEDYAILIKGGTNSSSSLYAGAWKANTKNYREATAYLTGRYATDTKYNQKLNGIIEAYDLQQYDNAPKIKLKVRVTRHKVKADETYWDLSKKYGTTITRIKELNEMDEEEYTLTPGDTLIVKREEIKPVQAKKPVAKKAPKKDVDDKATKAAKEKAAKEALLKKEANELVLIKAGQLGHAIKGAVPSVIFETQAPKVIGRQVKSDKTYTVAQGDTILTISKKIGVPLESLVEWNNLADSLLSEGQVLLVTSPFNTIIE